MFLRQSPVLRPLLAFLAGILTAMLYPVYEVGGYLCIAAGLFVIIIVIQNFKSRFSRQWIKGLIFSICLFAAGYEITILNKTILYNDHFSRLNADYLLVRITEPPGINKKIRFMGAAEGVSLKGTIRSSCGTLIVSIDDSIVLNYGDYLIIRSKPFPVSRPLNPCEFNYCRYLQDKQVYYQVFVRKDDYFKCSFNNCNPVYYISYQLRSYLISILKEASNDRNIYSVASALLVGYEEDLEQPLLKAYAASGALHVLSVSGMHVAIIYKVLEWILGFLMKMKRGRHLYYPLIIAVIWFYALLSGLSPSVLRAAMMLSVIITGKWILKPSAVFNTLAVSCFLLLVTNPFLITEVGFQLSLLAVIGIVVIHPLIFRIITPRGKFLYAVWSIISVSISAQLITFPLSLYYFHQFPNLFLIVSLQLQFILRW
jgi:competence protein ComEC